VVRQGIVEFSPAAAREELIAGAGHGGDWCLSHQVLAGERVPAARCCECGQLAVAAELPGSCGKCMGSLDPDESVLDSRFVAAVGALAAVGWPDDEAAPGAMASSTSLVVSPPGVVGWALRMA